MPGDRAPRRWRWLLPGLAGIVSVALGLGAAEIVTRAARAVCQPVLHGRLAAHRQRAGVGEVGRDRAVRHGRQGRPAHGDRHRALRALRAGRRRRGTPVAARPGADRRGRHSRSRRRGDTARRIDAGCRPRRHRGDRRHGRATDPAAPLAGAGAAVGTRGPGGGRQPPALLRLRGRRGRPRCARRSRRVRARSGNPDGDGGPARVHAAEARGGRAAAAGWGRARHPGPDADRHAEQGLLPDRHRAAGAPDRPGRLAAEDHGHGRPRGDAHLEGAHRAPRSRRATRP